MNELTPSPALLCANCGTALQGEFCHACGQSIHSVLRPVSHMLEDAGDLFLHMDERIVHTLPPLYTKPGFLTLEYFSGRRIRYVAPFRLMFVFCLLAFFFVHLAFSDVRFGDDDEAAPPDSVGAIHAAKTPEDVRRLYDAQIGELDAAIANPDLPAAAKKGLELGQDVVRDAANRRLAELKADPIPAPVGHAAPARAGDERKWTHEPTVVDIAWLPDVVTRRIAVGIGHFKANIARLGEGGEAKAEALKRMGEGFFSVLPQTMLVMIPVFALILKLFYAFRRRLYMEHIIVALHSHAFLFLSLLLLMVLGFAKDAIRPHAWPAASLIGLVQGIMWVWMPVYLLIMQKRVYRQAWPMTILKYWLIGSVYFWLLLFAVTVAFFIGASH
ncbi:Protein of unknown function [Luteibacter sp. UNC138MFCol5.1]|uniref:DUF3667 domain-containing protein n=1 Tax=Luteibacter sp. UNC138MFCol5.1 TaxID=1502774 RepID=UPI0008B41A92|nr:DUF3667 domain-containing protein [Luteibacter sp. UNC138MFCol5.1]SEP00266.1 Protein of unknown function [Luteibacter sp. UNC138MFCol5.1]